MRRWLKSTTRSVFDRYSGDYQYDVTKKTVGKGILASGQSAMITSYRLDIESNDRDIAVIHFHHSEPGVAWVFAYFRSDGESVNHSKAVGILLKGIKLKSTF